MDDEVYEGDVWYVVTENGPEQPFKSYTRAMMALDRLGVAGRIECTSALTKRRELKSTRTEDGTWISGPPLEVIA